MTTKPVLPPTYITKKEREYRQNLNLKNLWRWRDAELQASQELLEASQRLLAETKGKLKHGK
jgi:hypothetical protein